MSNNGNLLISNHGRVIPSKTDTVNAKRQMRRFNILVLMCLLTGCQHARSFLNMNSNSSSPFLGLELSVDAGNADAGKLTADGPLRRNEKTSAPLPSVAVTDDAAPMQLAAMDDTSRQFVKTSDLRQHTGNLKYALPTADLGKDPQQAAEVREIMDRLSGS